MGSSPSQTAPLSPQSPGTASSWSAASPESPPSCRTRRFAVAAQPRSVRLVFSRQTSKPPRGPSPRSSVAAADTPAPSCCTRRRGQSVSPLCVLPSFLPLCVSPSPLLCVSPSPLLCVSPSLHSHVSPSLHSRMPRPESNAPARSPWRTPCGTPRARSHHTPPPTRARYSRRGTDAPARAASRTAGPPARPSPTGSRARLASARSPNAATGRSGTAPASRSADTVPRARRRWNHPSERRREPRSASGPARGRRGLVPVVPRPCSGARGPRASGHAPRTLAAGVAWAGRRAAR